MLFIKNSKDVHLPIFDTRDLISVNPLRLILLNINLSIILLVTLKYFYSSTLNLYSTFMSLNHSNFILTTLKLSSITFITVITPIRELLISALKNSV